MAAKRYLVTIAFHVDLEQGESAVRVAEEIADLVYKETQYDSDITGVYEGVEVK